MTHGWPILRTGYWIWAGNLAGLQTLGEAAEAARLAAAAAEQHATQQRIEAYIRRIREGTD